METKKIAYLALGILVGGILVVGAGTYASGGRSISMHGFGMRGFEKTGSGSDSRFADLITKNVVNTASGVEMTLTTTDSGALAHLQQMTQFMKNKRPLDQTKASLTTVNIDKGVKVTISGTDADSIKRIQDMAANNNGLFPMMGGFGGKGGMMKGFRGEGFGRPGSGQSAEKSRFEDLVTKNVVNTASGAELTLTTTDSGALARLQGMVDMMNARQHPEAAKISITSVKIDNGIKLTITSSDADTVKRIQDQAASDNGLFPMGGRGGFGGKGGMMNGRGGGFGGMMRGNR